MTRAHLTALWIAVGTAAGACQGGSVGETPVSRCYPSPDACDASMFTGGVTAEHGDVAVGREIYEASCAECHGLDGKGTVKANTRRIDMTSPIWHARFRDGELAKQIREGKPPAMPTHALSNEQMADVVAFVRSLRREVQSPRPDGRGY